MTTRTQNICVIGSGPADGVLAKELAEGGAKVALVEGGRLIPPEKSHTHARPHEYPDRNGPSPGCYPEVIEAIHYEDSDHVGVDRIRAVGGRSINLRISKCREEMTPRLAAIWA